MFPQSNQPPVRKGIVAIGFIGFLQGYQGFVAVGFLYPSHQHAGIGKNFFTSFSQVFIAFLIIGEIGIFFVEIVVIVDKIDFS